MKFFDNVFSPYSEDIVNVSGLSNELICLNIYNNYIERNNGFLIVTSSTFEANNLYQNLLNYTDKVLFFPMDDFLTSEAIAISPEFMVERINTLNNLVEDSNYIVVTNLMGFLRYLPSRDKWIDSKIILKKNQDINREELIKKLYDIGYKREAIVNETGTIGIRGYVIDIFPVSYENAIRIEFWGDTIDSIKYFDIDTQLSTDIVDNVTIYPFTEFLTDVEVVDGEKTQKNIIKYEKNIVSLMDYINSCTLCFYDYKNIETSYSLLIDTINEYNNENDYEKNIQYMFSFDDFKINKAINYYHYDEYFKKENSYKYICSKIENYNGNYNIVKSDILKYLNENKTVILCIDSKSTSDRILKYLELEDIYYTDESHILKNKVNLINKKINSGFIYNEYVVISKNDLYNVIESNTKYKSKYRIGTKKHLVSDYEIGDYIVHEMFGIGLYQGLININKNGIQKDYIKLMYADGDILYIPVENINRISKYTGKEGLGIKLNSLSNDNWKKKKSKVREKLESIAKDLLTVSAEREITPGYAFMEDDENQAIFDSNFIYTETKDQLKAIAQIKKEMEMPKPMDMLLCGDVGYGKTEVAFRAIFKAVNSGKQVAYLCPTTILSNQQYTSALERFKTFPVNIALLNRFVDKKKQLETIEKLKKGKIDIVFGTHRLLSNDVGYKDLGLLIIDEEQRFGVTHKEKIKKIKANVDVLTLSATPIPRTLQMSMTGIRSLALIETPPKERYPIQTYVLEESSTVIKDAIYKELSRGGQIFILYNHVEKIQDKVLEIKKLIPEAKIDYAHGQMTKEQLENKMNDFINNKYNILVCTTIIETGIDIPNVNTLIILDADHFGLSQLYQIRGRIGRSNKIGYAYLMYDKHKFLNDIAIKRLDTIKEFTELGSGFKIAMRDLSIRGAGDILGREQSGFIDSVGIDLYLKMLNDAIRKSKGEKIEDEDVENNKINEKPLINVATHIDDKYVMDNELKIEIHQMINKVNSYESFCEIKDELENRFGKVNQDLIVYMYEEWFEKLASKFKINKLLDGKNFIDITLPKDLSEKINGEILFNEAYKISKMFRFSYKENNIHIILDKINLDEHYLIYLVSLFIKLNDIMK